MKFDLRIENRLPTILHIVCPGGGNPFNLSGLEFLHLSAGVFLNQRSFYLFKKATCAEQYRKRLTHSNGGMATAPKQRYYEGCTQDSAPGRVSLYPVNCPLINFNLSDLGQFYSWLNRIAFNYVLLSGS